MMRIPLKAGYVMAGMGLIVALLAVANVIQLMVRFGWEAAIDVDGGGGAAIAIVLFLAFFGLAVGMPLLIGIRDRAPRSWRAALVGLAVFCAIGGWFSSQPIPTFEHWLEGALFSLGFAAASLAMGAGLQWFVTRRPARSTER
jgi:hypothetical protein